MYVLAIAARSVEPSEVVATREDAEKNLSLLGGLAKFGRIGARSMIKPHAGKAILL